MVARNFVLRFLWFSFGILLLAATSQAQFSGKFQGTVSDPSGSAVAGAKVVLVNVATQVSATTTTDASGQYRFLSLAPGSYKIAVEATGFSKIESKADLGTNQELTLPITLKVAGSRTRVDTPFARP